MTIALNHSRRNRLNTVYLGKGALKWDETGNVGGVI